MEDDLLYRSVCRLKKFIELNAPSGIVLREAAIAMGYAVEKVHFPEEFAELCVEVAFDRETAAVQAERKPE